MEITKPGEDGCRQKNIDCLNKKTMLLKTLEINIMMSFKICFNNRYLFIVDLNLYIFSIYYILNVSMQHIQG